jgi:NADH pyrophosphatase NudC (nudix superfamily)
MSPPPVPVHGDCLYLSLLPISSSGIVRPQETQKRHAASSSALQAGQWRTVRFCPQCGQKVAARSRGSAPLQ